MDISNIKVDSLDDMIGAFNARIKKLKKSIDGFDIKESNNSFMENKAKLYKITYTDNESKDGHADDISIYAENENDARNKFKTYINKKDRFDIDSIEVDLVLTEDYKGDTFALSRNTDFENEFGYMFDSDTTLYAVSNEKDDPELFYQWASDFDVGYDLVPLEELLPDISIFDSISSAETYAKYDVLPEIYDNEVYIIAIKPDESTSYVKTIYK